MMITVKTIVACVFGKKRCSGFGVYPDGEKCPGCSDCMEFTITDIIWILILLIVGLGLYAFWI